MNPASGDVFFLRMLLHHDHCMGKTSFENLKTVDGELCESYQEVCRLLGLLQDDREWDDVLTEGSVTKLSPALRELFTTILLFCMPANPKELFEKHYLEWTDDFIHEAERNGCTLTNQQLRTMALKDLQQRLQSWDRQLSAIGLKEPSMSNLPSLREMSSTQPWKLLKIKYPCISILMLEAELGKLLYSRAFLLQ